MSGGVACPPGASLPPTGSASTLLPSSAPRATRALHQWPATRPRHDEAEGPCCAPTRGRRGEGAQADTLPTLPRGPQPSRRPARQRRPARGNAPAPVRTARVRRDLTRIFSGHTRHGVAPPTQLWTCPRAPHRGGRRSTSSHSTPNSMDGLQVPRGVPDTSDQILLGLLRRDRRPSSSQRVSDILWRRCLHTRTAFNGTHTAVLSEDQLGSTPDGSASITLRLWHAL